MSDAPLDAVVVGGGPAGLAVAYHLSRRGLRFAVLDERARVGDSWRARWDSLRLFTPGAMNSLPGLPFPRRRDPFPIRDEIADYLERYADTWRLPVRLGVRARAARRVDGGYDVTGDGDRWRARHLVLATGAHHTPRVPAFASRLDAHVVQLHSSEYRNPRQVRAETVLVVGAANSGTQIAEDLAPTHRVYLSVGASAWWPPRSLVRSTLAWRVSDARLRVFGEYHRRIPFPWPFGRFGGFVTPLPRELARLGVTLLPRSVDVSSDAVRFADGRELRPGAVVWATGYHQDLSWVDAPAGAPGLHVVAGELIPLAVRHARRVADAIG